MKLHQKSISECFLTVLAKHGEVAEGFLGLLECAEGVLDPSREAGRYLGHCTSFE